jgi:hypothetical protein
VSGLPPVLRNALIYVVCLPLALFLGYQLSNPLSYEAVSTVAIVFLVLITPVVLKWHQPLLFFAINASIIVPFWGRPKLGLVMVAVSLGVSILQRTLRPRFRFLSAPEIATPLFVIIVVVMATAVLRGGFGLRAFGGSSVGSSRYLMLILGALSFFAMTAQTIPANRRTLYTALFFLSGITAVVGDFFNVISPSLYLIYLVFPINRVADTNDFTFGETRLFGFTILAVCLMNYMLARYGIRGIFLEARRWRTIFFIVFSILIFLGGFRSVFIHVTLMLGFMFLLERVYRTRLVLPLILGGVLLMALTIVFLPKLPFTFQRSLAFLPLNVSPEARVDADSSSQWRIQMWKAVLPEVPNYLLLGKGLSFSEADFEANTSKELSARNPDQWLWAVIAGDYHNGPLSAVVTFGLWGFMALVWFHVAGWRVLLMAWRNGNPEVRHLNAFLLTKFLVHLTTFWFVSGSMYTETLIFASILGFSVALNGGVCRVPYATPAVASPAPALPQPLPPRPRPILAASRAHPVASQKG